MKKYLFLFLVLAALSSCATEPSTPNPAEVSMTMLADQVNAQATQVKLESVFTITAQVVNATSTQQAMFLQATGTQQARLDAQSTADQKRADAQATSEQARQDAQATQQRIDADATQAQARRDMDATAEQARLNVQSTQQAAGTATAGVYTMTAMPFAMTLMSNEVQMSNLQVQQQVEKNTPQWVIPYFVAVVSICAAALYVYRYSRVREVKDDDGAIQVLVLDGNRVLRPQLMPGPVIEISKEEVTMPMLTDHAEQSKVTERAQMVEAISSIPSSPNPAATQAFNKYFGAQREAPFEVIDADDAPPAGLIDGEAVKSLEQAWKDAKDGR